MRILGVMEVDQQFQVAFLRHSILSDSQLCILNCWEIVLPFLRRLRARCLHMEFFNVISLNATFFDLRTVGNTYCTKAFCSIRVFQFFVVKNTTSCRWSMEYLVFFACPVDWYFPAAFVGIHFECSLRSRDEVALSIKRLENSIMQNRLWISIARLQIPQHMAFSTGHHLQHCWPSFLHMVLQGSSNPDQPIKQMQQWHQLHTSGTTYEAEGVLAKGSGIRKQLCKSNLKSGQFPIDNYCKSMCQWASFSTKAWEYLLTTHHHLQTQRRPWLQGLQHS